MRPRTSWFRKGAARPFVYGHRGVRGPVPENTLAAFQRADDEGADGIELDVRLCKSGEVVVFHDATLKRMTHDFDNRAIADLSLQQLKRIDVQGETIPTLREVLEWLRLRPMKLNVEIKRDVPSRTALVRAVAKELKGELPGRLMISSFDPFMLSALLPLRVPLGILFHQGQEKYRPWEWAARGPWHAAHPEAVLSHSDAIARMHKKGRFVNVWTVNTVQEALRLAALGVDGIITDKPGLLLQNF